MIFYDTEFIAFILKPRNSKNCLINILTDTERQLEISAHEGRNGYTRTHKFLLELGSFGKNRILNYGFKINDASVISRTYY